MAELALMANQGAQALVIADPQVRAAMEEKDRQIQQLSSRILDLESRVREPNWPPFLPIVHHHIAREIPDRRQKYVRVMFFNYYFTCLTLLVNSIFNFVIANADMKEDKNSEENDEFKKNQWMGLAYLLGILLAFPLWYWQIYRSVATGASGKYVMSIVGVVLALGGTAFSIVGVPGYGALGFMCMTKAFSIKASKTPGYLALSTLAMWSVSGALLVLALVWQIRYYRKDKASLRSAKADVKNVVSAAI